jgi:ABC-type transporter Mla subunit MlaD
MAKARTTRMRAIVVLIAGLLAATVVWAGTALGGGSGGGEKPSKPATPARSDTGSIQDGKRVTDRDCPKDRAHEDSSIDL